MTDDVPPRDPLVDPPPLVTRAELERLTALRRVAPWYRESPTTGREDDLLFLLELVDRLLGRGVLPDEDPYRASSADDRWTVESGSSVYMCGHGSWYVRERGRPGIVVSLTANVLDASRLRDLLNGREVNRGTGGR